MPKSQFRPLSDQEKLRKILDVTGLGPVDLAKELEVTYRSVHRWLLGEAHPHPRQANDIDQLFKEHVDLRPVVMDLKKSWKDPAAILRSSASLRDRLILAMTYHSNAIEGSRMTIRETSDALDGKTVRGKEFFEVMEAVNHRNAMLFVLDAVRPGFVIDETFVFKLHSIVMYNFHDKLPGKYRTGFVNLTNTEKVLPSAQMVPVKMRAWFKEVNGAEPDPLTRAAHDHYEFEAIHPFFDGNGRTGRLVLMAQLLSQGLAPAVVEVEDRYKYYMALGKGDMGEFKSMIQMLCDAVMKGYEFLSTVDAVAAKEKKGDLT
jgi:hypothetical protein